MKYMPTIVPVLAGCIVMLALVLLVVNLPPNQALDRDGKKLPQVS